MFPTLLGVITEVDGNKARVNFMTHGNIQGTVKWPTCQDEAWVSNAHMFYELEVQTLILK